MTNRTTRVKLHPKQSIAFKTDATELLYGGAAGGGKSLFLRVSDIRWCLSVPGIQVYLFRRNYPDLKSNHLRGASNLLELLGPLMLDGKCKFSEMNAEFRFWNGSCLKLAHLARDADLLKYQGAEIHVLSIDELTHFTAHQYRYLRGRVRLGGLKVPAEFKHLLPRSEAGSNPGNIGHAWVKAGFVTSAKPLEKRRMSREEGGMLRQFIPAKLDDNPTLLENDPDYEARLTGLGSPALVRALRDGDWDIVAGQAFEMWRREKHVIEPFEIPQSWMKFRSMDWGSSKPFSVGWWAVSDGTTPEIPGGALIRYREWYGWDGSPDHGARLTSTEVARGIRQRETERVSYSVADPAIFSKHDGPTIAENMAREGVIFREARGNAALNSRKAGYQEMRNRMIGEDGRPMLYVFSTCIDGFIRTVPDLVLDERNPEDVDTRIEDHAYDEARYAVMSRPWIRSVPRSTPRRRDYNFDQGETNLSRVV